MTPLHWAVIKKQIGVIELLLGHELIIDKNPPDNEGKTPLHDAASDGYTEIVELFLNHIIFQSASPFSREGAHEKKG